MRRPDLIGMRIEEEVLRRLGHVGRQLSDEFFAVGQLEAVILLLLRAQGAEVASADGLSTGRTAAMAGVKSQVIAQNPQLLH